MPHYNNCLNKFLILQIAFSFQIKVRVAQRKLELKALLQLKNNIIVMFSSKILILKNLLILIFFKIKVVLFIKVNLIIIKINLKILS